MGIELSGKVAIVTGAARGIGKGVATALLQAGAAVTLTDVRAETLDQTSVLLAGIRGAEHLAVVADGTDDDDVDRAVRTTVETFGRIDVLVNNAQRAVTGVSLEDQTVEDVMVAIDSGFLASFRYLKACFPFLKESQGTVVNVASQAGLVGNWGMVGYNATKEANRALTRTAAREWGPHNITVNCIVPSMQTEGSQEYFDAHPEHARQSLAHVPLGRVGDSERDFGALVVFLASDGARYITGETFHVDGGRSMRP